MNFAKVPVRAVDRMPENWRRLVHEYGARAYELWILHDMGELRGSTFDTIKAQLEHDIGLPIRAKKKLQP